MNYSNNFIYRKVLKHILNPPQRKRLTIFRMWVYYIYLPYSETLKLDTSHIIYNKYQLSQIQHLLNQSSLCYIHSEENEF